LEEWNSDDICIRALDKENAEKYMRLKMEEWREYESLGHVAANTTKITKWELQRYLFT